MAMGLVEAKAAMLGHRLPRPGRRSSLALQLAVFGAIGTFVATTYLGASCFLPPAETRGNVDAWHRSGEELLRSSAAVTASAAGALFASVDGAAEAAEGGAAAAAEPANGLLVAGGVLAVIAAAGAFLLSDGGSEAVDDKAVVREYFNNEGFGRWKKIYGETDDVNPVQLDIRKGHAMTVDKILGWLDGGAIDGKTVCDAGCGTGNLSIPLASRGALVNGSDISSAMVSQAAAVADDQLKDVPTVRQMPSFKTSDLEELSGEFDCVCCVDVLIHYPPENLDGMVGNLARLSKDRLILSFAPKTWYYVALKRIGELFPGKSKTTRAYLHEEAVVEQALEKAGFKVTRREMTATSFYFSRLLEARPASLSA